MPNLVPEQLGSDVCRKQGRHGCVCSFPMGFDLFFLESASCTDILDRIPQGSVFLQNRDLGSTLLPASASASAAAASATSASMASSSKIAQSSSLSFFAAHHSLTRPWRCGGAGIVFLMILLQNSSILLLLSPSPLSQRTIVRARTTTDDIKSLQ